MKEKQQKERRTISARYSVPRDALTERLPRLRILERPSGSGRAPPAPSGSGRRVPGAALTFAARRAGTLPLRRAPASLRGVPRVPDPARRGAALRQRRGARRGPTSGRRGRRGGRRRRRQLVRPRGAAPGPAAARRAAASPRRLRGRGGAGPPASGRRARGADAARGGRRARETPARGAGAAPRGAAMLLLLLELEGHRGPHGLQTAARSRSAARRRRAPSPGGGGGGRGAAAPHALVGHRPPGPAAGSREKGAGRGRVLAGIRRLGRPPCRAPLAPGPELRTLPAAPPCASSTIVPRPPAPPRPPRVHSHWPRRRSARAVTARPLAAGRAAERPGLRGERERAALKATRGPTPPRHVPRGCGCGRSPRAGRRGRRSGSGPRRESRRVGARDPAGNGDPRAGSRPGRRPHGSGRLPARRWEGRGLSGGLSNRLATGLALLICG